MQGLGLGKEGGDLAGPLAAEVCVPGSVEGAAQGEPREIVGRLDEAVQQGDGTVEEWLDGPCQIAVQMGAGCF